MTALSTLTRHAVAALALWAGASLPAGAQRAAGASSPDTAVSLPQPLRAQDAQRLRRAFQAQARGDWAAAAREAERVQDRRLMGHLSADRLLRQGASAGYAALQAWLADHSDLPDAPDIHQLLLAALPQGAAMPPPPHAVDAAVPLPDFLTEEEAPAENGRLVRNLRLDRQVQARIAAGRPDQAMDAVRAAGRLAPAYAAQLRAEIAQALFRRGEDADALALALEALRTDPHNHVAAHQAGLAAWSLGRYELAFAQFERAARSERTPPAMRASAAYWAARAAVRARRPAEYTPWMLLAAQEPRSFHGMIARRSLGLPPGLVWERDIAAAEEAASLAETAGGWRALALLQIGQEQRAEAELRLLHRRARNNPLVVQGILAVAQRAGLGALAGAVASQGGPGAPDTARFPMPRLMPAGGFRMDPALLYAIALQESRFNANAVSRAGARGLMQIMPATASYIANDPSLRGDGIQRLHDPAFSLELGQRYVHYLARHEAVQGDLIRLLAAYNAGPGNLARWLPAASHRDDPVLFIESIPVAETRAFVQRVLTFSWAYANRMDLPAPSLDALAGGRFPAFAGVEEVTAMLRLRPQRLN